MCIVTCLYVCIVVGCVDMIYSYNIVLILGRGGRGIPSFSGRGGGGGQDEDEGRCHPGEGAGGGYPSRPTRGYGGAL